MIRRARAARSGAAAPEFAVVMSAILVPLMLGVWEMGRYIHVRQVVAHSVREGARLAAQARTINQVGAPSQIVASIAPADNTLAQPNVKSAVVQALHGAGLTTLGWDDVTVTFAFTSGDTTRTQPHQGEKDQEFEVSVSIPWDKVRWIDLGIIQPTTVSYQGRWRIMVDDPFTVNTTLPGF